MKIKQTCIALFLLLLPGCQTAEKPSPIAGSPKVTPRRAISTPFRVTLTDVTSKSGLNFRQRNGATGRHNFLETTGSGACWFDYNNDGWMDCYLVQNGALPGSAGFGPGGNRLYQNNRNGTFRDVTQRAGVAGRGYGQGVTAADYDNDGFVDLFVTCYGRNILYRNFGNGTFKDVTATSGLSEPQGWSVSAAFADYDGDGFLDLYVGHYCDYRVGEDPHCAIGADVYSYCPPTQFKGESGRLYRNNGNGTFKDTTQAAGAWQPEGKNLGVVWGDFNNDNKIDLFVANDNRRNALFQNNGDGTFKDVAISAGVALTENGRAMAGMGTDWGDYDNDGQLDLVAANFSDQPNVLWRNEGNGLFSDVTFTSKTGPPSLPHVGWGTAWADLDLDGWKELIVANGHVADNIHAARKDLSFAQPNLLCRNLGDGTFSDESRSAGSAFAKPRVGRGMALADFDNDGDLDVLLTPLNAPATLLRNEGGNRNRWIGVHCKGVKGNRDAIGARVTITTDALQQVAEVRSASGYLSQNDPRLFFGLGSTKKIDKIEVRWPIGKHSQQMDVAVNQVLTIVQEK